MLGTEVLVFEVIGSESVAGQTVLKGFWKCVRFR